MNKIGNTVKLLRITGIFFVAAMFSILPALNVCAKQITSGKGSYDFDGSGALCVYDMTDEDIKNILEQKKTTAIELNGCTITEPDTLNQDYLEIITLDNCKIKAKNFKFNENLENLQIVDYANGDMSFFENNSFDTIWFKYCEFDNLKFLEKLKSAEAISFFSCSLGSIKGVEKVQGLEYLEFANVGIEDISLLKDNETLKTLKIRNTCVTDISPLENTNISCLDIANSPIKSLRPLTKMKNLDLLWAENTEMIYDKEIVDSLNAKQDGLYEYSDDAAEIQAEVRQLAKSLVNDSMTYEKKICTITEYVAGHIEYDYEHCDTENNDDMVSEYNTYALKHALDGKGICVNYAMLCDALFRECGIECYLQLSDDHIWNVVRIGDDYRVVDATYISSGGFQENNYLAKFEEYSNVPGSYPTRIYLMRRNIQPDEIDEIGTAEEVNSQAQSQNTVIICSAAAIVIILLLVIVIKKKKAKGSETAETVNEYNNEQNGNEI